MLREQEVLEEVWFDFGKSGERVNMESEEIKVLTLGVWEDGKNPGCNTPHWAKAQRVFPLALSTWKKERGSEYK